MTTSADQETVRSADDSYRLAILNSHPIQYFAPLFRRIAQEPDIELTVLFCSSQGVERYHDAGFGASVRWDVPLLEGYASRMLPNLRRSGVVAGFFSLINPGVLRELRRGRYDALWVHGHGYATFMLAILAARVFRIPVLMRGETHLLLRRSALKRLVRAGLMRLLYTQFCAVCLPIGSRNREFYCAHGVGDQRLFLVPYVVDNRFFSDATARCRHQLSKLRRRHGLPEHKPAILFASKLMPRKRPMDLLLAFERARSMGLDASLLFVGSGELEQSLRQYATGQDIPDVHFYGFKNQSELPEFYALADVFVLPSENEPWGLIINEAMAAGLPVIATREIGAVADLVADGDNGLVYDAGDVPALADRLLRLGSDPELRRAMGRRSAERIAGWDLERCTGGIRDALHFVARRRLSPEPSDAAARLRS